MIDFKNIATVATYERKTLFRSWFFRIFALVTLFVMFMVNMGLFGHSYANWAGRAVPANIPYANVLIVSVAQAIIAVFLSSDFLKRDKKLDTTEVIYARPISNGEYVVGKTAGIMSLFLALLLVVLLMALTFNLIIKDTPVVWEAYLLYPLLVTIPTLIFILGLSFFLMILLKNQAVTFIVLLGYIGLALFYFKDRLDGLLDYMAFNFPMVYSDFIGFGDTSSILVHRLCYLLLGLGFIFGTIRFLSRLPQTGKWNFINLFGFVFFLAAGMAVGYKYYDSHQDSYARGNRYLAMNNAYAHMPVPDVSSNDLKVVQKDHGLVISSSLRIRNTMGSTLDTLLFSLNPGFIVDSISDSNGPVKWERKEQLVLIMPEKGLSPWRGTSLRIDYHGVPDRAVAYLDITRKERSSLKNVNLMKFDKFAGIVDPEYVLLTSEMIWYPVAGVGFNRTDFLSSVPDFARFSIEVQPRPGLTALCPGLSEPGDSVFRFRPEQELNSLPLVIGPLEKHSKIGRAHV